MPQAGSDIVRNGAYERKCAWAGAGARTFPIGLNNFIVQLMRERYYLERYFTNCSDKDLHVAASDWLYLLLLSSGA